MVLCLANAHRPLLARAVYTAASRAKEALIVVAPPGAMRVARRRSATTAVHDARAAIAAAPEAPSCPATAVAAAEDAAARKREAEDT